MSSERLVRLFFFILFEVEMLVLAAAAVYVVRTTFRQLQRIEHKVDDLTKVMKRQ